MLVFWSPTLYQFPPYFHKVPCCLQDLIQGYLAGLLKMFFLIGSSRKIMNKLMNNLFYRGLTVSGGMRRCKRWIVEMKLQSGSLSIY
jgi:hypothetical protein